MENKVPPYLLQPLPLKHEPAKVGRAKISFLDNTILNSAKAVKSIYLQAESAATENFIQKINPHVKFFSLIYLVVVISFVNRPEAQILISAFIFTLYLIARLRILQVYRRIFSLAFIFGFLVVFPASLNIITPGKIIFNLINLNKPVHFWIFSIPRNIGFTDNGFHVVSLVFLRVINSISIALLIVFTTSFPSFIKSFKIIGLPDTFLMIISLAYKYIFILSRTIEDTYFALKSRFLGNAKNSSIRKLVSGRVFFIFKRSTVIYENTFYAMVSRGYHGEIKLYSQSHFAFRDFVALVIVIVLGIVIILI